MKVDHLSNTGRYLSLWSGALLMLGLIFPVALMRVGDDRAFIPNDSPGGYIRTALGLAIFLAAAILPGKVGKRYSLPGALLGGLLLAWMAWVFVDLTTLSTGSLYVQPWMGYVFHLSGAGFAVVGGLWKVPGKLVTA